VKEEFKMEKIVEKIVEQPPPQVPQKIEKKPVEVKKPKPIKKRKVPNGRFPFEFIHNNETDWNIVDLFH
jgi:hypothetical protein